MRGLIYASLNIMRHIIIHGKNTAKEPNTMIFTMFFFCFLAGLPPDSMAVDMHRLMWTNVSLGVLNSVDKYTGANFSSTTSDNTQDIVAWGQHLQPLPGKVYQADDEDSANTKHLYNICTMLGQRRRRWADVVQNICITFVRNICITFVQRWANVEDVGPTLYKWYTNVLCLLGIDTIVVLHYCWAGDQIHTQCLPISSPNLPLKSSSKK